MKKGQFSIEFITGVSIMLVLYVITIGAYSYYTENTIIEDVFAENICYKIANGIDAAVIGRDGFSINTTIPYRVYGDELDGIYISQNHTITVDWSNRIIACSIVTNNITNITAYPGKISATNIDETIYVTSIKTDKFEYARGEDITINASYIKGTDADLTMFFQNGSLANGPVTRTAVQNEINYTWSPPLVSEVVKIAVIDNDYQNLNAEKEIRII